MAVGRPLHPEPGIRIRPSTRWAPGQTAILLFGRSFPFLPDFRSLVRHIQELFSARAPKTGNFGFTFSSNSVSGDASTRSQLVTFAPRFSGIGRCLGPNGPVPAGSKHLEGRGTPCPWILTPKSNPNQTRKINRPDPGDLVGKSL